jgi:hypothetical protein
MSTENPPNNETPKSAEKNPACQKSTEKRGYPAFIGGLQTPTNSAEDQNHSTCTED